MDTPHRPDTDTTRPAPARRKRPRRLVAGLAALLISVLAPATVAPAAVGQTAEDETHTLTVKILDHNGETPCLGCVPAAVDAYNDTWDRDNPHGNTYYRIPGYATSDTATRSVEVVTGVYTLIGNLYKTADHADRTSVTYLIEVEVPVEGDTTVVLDAREAVLMEPPTVPKTDAQVRGHTFTLSKEGSFWDDNSWADYGEYLDGTNYASLKDFDLYITPFPEPTLMRLVLVDNWIMAEPQEMRPDPYDSSGTQLYSDTPAYMYHVPRVYTAGFDAGTLEQPYTSDDFTTVPTHYHSDYDDALIGTISKAFSTHHLGGRAEVVMFRPGKVLQHYLASDEVVWRKSDWIHRDETAQPLRARTYEAFPAAGAGTVQPVQDRHSGPVRVAVSDTDGPYTDLWKSNSQSDPYLTPYVPPGMLRGGEHGERFRPTFCLNDNAGGIRFYSACPNLGTWQMQNADTGQILLPDLTQLVPVFTAREEGDLPPRAAYRCRP